MPAINNLPIADEQHRKCDEIRASDGVVNASAIHREGQIRRIYEHRQRSLGDGPHQRPVIRSDSFNFHLGCIQDR